METDTTLPVSQRERERSQDRNILSSTWLQELHIEIKLKLKPNQCNEKK